MGNKNKTVSFRVNEDRFGELRDLAEDRDISLSNIFRNYVQEFVDHNGKVTVVPKHETFDENNDRSFPPTVDVPKSFIREHERLEMETDHLREQLDEYKRHLTELQSELEAHEQDDVVALEDLDYETGLQVRVE